MSGLDNFTPQQTQDGSFTFFSEEFDEAFHSHYGARQETYLKFVLPSQVQRVAENGLVHKSGFQADAIFLDTSSLPQCPQLWTVEFIQKLSLCLHRNGLIATYSCAAAVRTALLAAGLVIGSRTRIGRHTPVTIAAYPINESVDNWGNGRKEINPIPSFSQSELDIICINQN